MRQRIKGRRRQQQQTFQRTHLRQRQEQASSDICVQISKLQKRAPVDSLTQGRLAKALSSKTHLVELMSRLIRAAARMISGLFYNGSMIVATIVIPVGQIIQQLKNSLLNFKETFQLIWITIVVMIIAWLQYWPQIMRMGEKRHGQFRYNTTRVSIVREVNKHGRA